MTGALVRNEFVKESNEKLNEINYVSNKGNQVPIVLSYI